MGVSKNRDTPNPSILIGFSIINHPFWGTPIFGNTHIIYIYISYVPHVSIPRLPCPLGFQSATLHESRFACRKQWHFLSAPVTFHRVFRLIRVSLCILDVFWGNVEICVNFWQFTNTNNCEKKGEAIWTMLGSQE